MASPPFWLALGRVLRQVRFRWPERRSSLTADGARHRDVRYPSLCCPRTAPGRLPEWPKGAVCKTVGLAYVGSNPTPATIKLAGQTRSVGPGLVRCGSGLDHRSPCGTSRFLTLFGQVRMLLGAGSGLAALVALLSPAVEQWLGSRAQSTTGSCPASRRVVVSRPLGGPLGGPRSPAGSVHFASPAAEASRRRTRPRS